MLLIILAFGAQKWETISEEEKKTEHNENMYDRASIENENETALILSESHFNQIQIMANHTHKSKLKIYKCQSINDRSTRKNIRTKCANIVVKWCV